MLGALATCSCMSPQEYTISVTGYGENYKYYANHKRFFRIFERCVDEKIPFVDIQRARYFTESMKKTENQPLSVRYGKALLHIAKNIPIYIEDDQLIVGRTGSDISRHGILYPEVEGDTLAVGLRDALTRTNAPLVVDPEDVAYVEKEIAPYWADKTFRAKFVSSLPEEMRKYSYNGPAPYTFIGEQASMNCSLQWVPDYAKVINRGIRAIKEEALARIDKLNPDDPVQMSDKKDFLTSVIDTCDAIVIWANRHADLAEKKAAVCADPVRRAELLRIAVNCRRVPEYPARDFYEAVQAQWFTQGFSRLERRHGGIISNGRMDQYLYPFYKKDKEAGILDDDKALEIFDCLWLQMAQYMAIGITPQAATQHEGYAHWEALTLGGQDRHGFDATNELSYLILRSKRETPLQHPDLAVRIHSRSPKEFLWAVAETVKTGQGYPKIFNDEEIIPLYVSKGASMSDALDYALSGCTEVRLPNVDTYTSLCTQVNYGAVIELVMRNGRLKDRGDEVFTFETGDPENFSTYEEFREAFKKQLQWMLRHAMFMQYRIERMRAQTFACPFESMLSDVAFAACRDLDSVEKIPGGVDLAYYECIGFATAVDSLAAVKKMVYDEKLVSMKELKDALDCNFEGKNGLRELLAKAPCFGNNDPYADEIGLDVETMSQEVTSNYVKYTGVNLDNRTTTITSNVPYGKIVGATPNGRLAGMPLSDGSSPSQGMDRNGPTAILLSNYHSKNWASTNRAARLLNIKFTPKAVEGDEGTERLVNFLRTFCDLKLWHIQFNVINRQTLLAAQQDPKKYRNLMVRVAGYSAYFVDLSLGLQNDIISRTAQDAI